MALKEAAAYLGVSVWTVRDLVRRGQLPVVRLTRRLHFDRRDIDRLIDVSKENGMMIPVLNQMIYAKTFFDLQLQFAEKVSALSRLPLERALLDYTNLYIRFGFGHDFDLAHPGWREYLVGLRDTDNHSEWTYRFYVRRSPGITPPGVVATFGCFSYASLRNDSIRLHFQNDRGGGSSLGIERHAQRLIDLAALFRHVKRREHQPLTMVGASWLYNIDPYRRLFPKAYLATARVIHGRFQHMPLWGQFVNRFGEIKESLAHEFLRRLERQSSLDGLDDCFPLQVLRVEAAMDDLYDFYGI